MSRLPKQPILYEDRLNIPEKYLRFATPEVVALYRADKLKCEKLVEIGAGIGGQTFAFAKVCKKVLAVESNKSSANILIQNLIKLHIENVEVITADALSKKAVEKIKKFQPDIIFCDTERPEKAERTLENIKPSIKKILEIFSEVTSKIAIEIPPFTHIEPLRDMGESKSSYLCLTHIENLDYNFEREFISINQQLNRLTLYFNELKQNDISAISLPSKEKIIKENSKSKIKNSAKSNDYLYSIDPTIILADLISELANRFNVSVLELNKPVLLSDKKISSDFLTGYKILAICKNEQKEILQNLKKIRAGKVILRYNVPPSDYWKIRNSYEKELSGKREISLFIDEKNNEAILTENIKSAQFD